jgi:excisionase family DNA binding protein
LGAPLSSKPGTLADRLLTTREVAAFLGVSPETVLRRWRAGELPGYRLASNVLRFRESEIEAWLMARGPGAAEEVAPIHFHPPAPERSLTVAPIHDNRGGHDAR